MKIKIQYFCLASLIIGITAIQACKIYYFRSNYNDANKLLHDTKNIETKPFLKAHLKNGDVLILKDTWKVDTITNVVSGTVKWSGLTGQYFYKYKFVFDVAEGDRGRLITFDFC